MDAGVTVVVSAALADGQTEDKIAVNNGSSTTPRSTVDAVSVHEQPSVDTRNEAEEQLVKQAVTIAADAASEEQEDDKEQADDDNGDNDDEEEDVDVEEDDDDIGDDDVQPLSPEGGSLEQLAPNDVEAGEIDNSQAVSEEQLANQQADRVVSTQPDQLDVPMDLEPLSREEMFRRKLDVVYWLQELLRPDNIQVVPEAAADVDEAVLNMNLFDLLKSGHLMCRALNNLMAANPSFAAQNLPPIEVRERLDMFSNLTNLNNFVRTCELYFNVDSARLMDPVLALADSSEDAFIDCLYFLKLVVSQVGIDFPVSLNKPYVSMTYDQLSSLVAMLTGKPGQPQIAYDPRVVMSVQDTDAFQRLSAKIDSIEASQKTVSMLTATMNSNFDRMDREQTVIKSKLDAMVEGVLGAFQDVSDRLRDLKTITDVVGTSADGLRSVVATLESKNAAASIVSQQMPQQQRLTRLGSISGLPAQQQGFTSSLTLSPGSQLRAGLSRNAGLAPNMELSKSAMRLAAATGDASLVVAPGAAMQKSVNMLEATAKSDDMSVRRLSGAVRPSQLANSITAAVPTLTTTTTATAESQQSSAAPGPTSAPAVMSRPSLISQQSAPKIFKLPDNVLNKNLPKDEVMRQSVLYETIESETDYVRDLNQMINGHCRDLKAKKILDEQQLKSVFGNIEALLAVNQQMLSLMVTRRDQNPVIDGIGDIFLTMVDKLAVYDDYCANYPVAMSLLKDMKGNEAMKAYADAAIANPEYRGLSLESFLIKPVQRICKYPLLLRELLRKTRPDHADFPLLQGALNKLEVVVASVNEKTRTSSDRDKLLELQTRIDATPPLDLSSISGLKLVKESLVHRYVGGKPKDRLLVLFNGSFMICKQQLMNKTRYQLESVHDLTQFSLNLTVNLKSLGSAGSKLAKTMFELVPQQQQPQPQGQLTATAPPVDLFIFNCPTEPERQKWVTAIEETIRDALKRGPGENKLVKALTAPPPAPVAKPSSAPASGSSLKKSNTLSLRKRPNLFGRKKNSSESLVEGATEEQEPVLETDPADTPNECEFLIMTEKDHLAKHVYHLSFPSGTYMRVVNKSRNDFWKVEMKNLCGWVPAAIVSIKDNNAIGADQVAEQLRICRTVATNKIVVHGSTRRRSFVVDPAAPQQQQHSDVASLRRGSSTSSHQLSVHQPESAVESSAAAHPPAAEPTQVVVPGYPQWRALDSGNGTVYYYNIDTSETTWYHPGITPPVRGEQAGTSRGSLPVPAVAHDEQRRTNA